MAFVIEALGQPSQEAVALMRALAPRDAQTRGPVLSAAYRHLSSLLACRQAELLMQAEHWNRSKPNVDRAYGRGRA